jgi:RNA polymerase sigma-70 factor (ECF subfamily)
VTTLSEDDHRALQELYSSCYARLVGVVGAVCRDLDDAEEAVQEAFISLMGQWAKVSGYDDPEAWVRKVALAAASNRRRKIRNGVRAARRHGSPVDAPAPTGTAVDLTRALAALPRVHREVLVLRHLGLEVLEVARELDIPEGTVKSRLSRGRAALDALLREDVTEHAES